MLKLTNETVYYGETELGSAHDMDFTGEGFNIALPDGSMVFIPKQDCTAEETEVFAAYHQYYADTGGIKPPAPLPDPVIIPEPVDEEKAALAEAVIDLSMQLQELREEITALKGGE